MASSQTKGSGLPKSQDTDSEAQSLQKPLRSMASRGPLFDDLGAAFRQIAANKGSKPSKSSQKVDQQGQSGSLNKSQKGPGNPPSENQPIGAIVSHTEDVAVLETSPFAAGKSLTNQYTIPTKSSGPVTTMATDKGQSGKADGAPAPRMADASLDTGSKDTQPGRHEDATKGRNGMRPHQRPSEPPQGSLPSVPHHRQGGSELKPGAMQDSTRSTDSTVSNSQDLLDADVQVNELRQAHQPALPSPLRFPSKLSRKDSDVHNDSESSSIGNTTASSFDPFRYDSQRYQNFMHPSNERDVSRALKRLSKVGEASEVSLITPEASQFAKVADKVEQGEQSEGLQSDVPAKKVRDLRVQIHRKPQLEPEEAVSQDKPHKLTRSKAYLRLDKLVREPTRDGDWVTEATSDATFGLNGIVKQTGSSIANYSDDEKENVPTILNNHRAIILHPAGKTQPEAYEMHTLKHKKQQIMLPKSKYSVFPTNSERVFSSSPRETSTTNQSLPRNISNPFSKNNYRQADIGGNFFNSVARGGSKYEFRDSVSEYALNSQLGQSRPQSKLFDGNLENGVLGKYLKDNPESKMEGVGSPGSQPQTNTSSRDVEASPRKLEQRHVDQMYPARQRCANLWRLERQEKDSSDFGQGRFIGEPLSTRSKFEFELLPLEEAQRKQKLQRESGESDETLPAEERYKRAKSSSLPASSPITVPLPTLSRRQIGPHLSTEFSWTSLRDAFEDTPSPFSATSRPTPLSSAAKRSLLRHHDSPTATSDVSSTPTRKFFSRYTPRIFFPRQEEEERRVTSDQTIIRHHALPQLESGLSLAAMEALMEQSISEDARRRRAHWFYLMATISLIMPFFAILVLCGALDESLVWYTSGAVRRVTIKQRNFIRNAFLAECCLYVVLVASIIAVYTKKF
ncbi:hypothetical protein F4818DRAFT_453458 [Hypoxylon cercidicola]|nr:hypothetical protein F4818DRAFT_453458 [Hypoxylon cercidicola]